MEKEIRLAVQLETEAWLCRALLDHPGKGRFCTEH